MIGKNIFHSERDHYKWAKQKEYTCSQENIDEKTRNKAVIALEFLEQEFGKHFLRTHSINHPVKQKISNTAPWQIEEMIEFTETLRYLKETATNYKKLMGKLLSEHESRREGIPFVDIAQMLHREEMDIEFVIESKQHGEKRPDIQVINKNNGDKLYIEISTLNSSEERKKIKNNHNFFYEQFNYEKPLLYFFGEQKKIIQENEYPEIKEIIDGIRKRVEKEKQLIYYSDKRFNFLMAPIENQESFNEVCTQNNINPLNFEGMPLNFDETNRLNNKIKKAKQIPKGYNGLLYISVNPLYFIATDMSPAIERLEANIKEHKHLLGIVLFTKIVDIRDQIQLKMGNHLYARRNISNLCYESLFIYNNNCDVLVSDATLQKIYKTL